MADEEQLRILKPNPGCWLLAPRPLLVMLLWPLGGLRKPSSHYG